MGQVTGRILAQAEDITWLRVDVGLPMAARREAARLAHRVGLDGSRGSAVELAVTEAATNLQKHATDGSVALRVVRAGPLAAVEFVATDTGPGIADVARVMVDGTSSTGSLGLGLGSIVRLADVFDIHTVRGRGTTVLAQFWAEGRVPSPPPAGIDTGGLTRPIGGEEVCGDTWAIRTAGTRPPAEEAEEGAEKEAEAADAPEPVVAMMCDGLGHGPQAARAANAAREAFRDSPHTQPARILDDLHRALRGTRGAAVAVAAVDLAAGRVDFCGVGNVSTVLVRDDRRTSLLSAPGIVGHHLPRMRPFTAPFPAGSVLVLHTDGLSDRWEPRAFPGLFARRATVVSAQILREAGGRRDDVGVLALKAARR
ncbi:SpoIIE family protein phosphatase [Streptomyces sp. NPDC047002]|uniref:SpoIIE family protein phosphatase n=1 Tax=Streptomyces sp. NPDC047002 TaxID=3155475 RepID=UPI00345648CA